jgi:hypothetical protein
MLHIYVVCLCYMFRLHVYAASMLLVRSACPCCMCMLHVHAAFACCLSMFFVHAVCLSCTSILDVYSACQCCMSMFHGHAAYPRCSSMLLNAACPCLHCMLRVHAALKAGITPVTGTSTRTSVDMIGGPTSDEELMRRMDESGSVRWRDGVTLTDCLKNGGENRHS